MTRAARTETVRSLFRCPDDSGELSSAEGGYRCERCARGFPVRPNGVLELLAARRTELPPSEDPLVADAIEVYERLFAEEWREQESPQPWGHWDTLPPRMRRHYRRMQRIVNEIAPREGAVCLDISAGNGTLSRPLRERFETFVAADLSVAAVNWLSLDPGVIVVRADYLRSPYKPESFDFVLCTDTLVYGRAHEERLLASLWSAVAPDGAALLQFHHRPHHNPLTPPVTVGYTREEMCAMLQRLTPPPTVRLHPFYQEFDENLRGGGLAALARRVFPATRYFIEARKPRASSPPEGVR